MTEINLHTIFRHITGDEKLLSTVVMIDNNSNSSKKSGRNSKKKFNMMSSVVTEYNRLSQNETQKYRSFPHSVKEYLTPDYKRLGITNMINRNMINVNVSFLNSLNILLRPDIYHENNDSVYMKDLILLEEFIQHRLSRNFQIDKVIKNTKKVQVINKELAKNISEGKITHELIQCIVNIFEINLLIFDFTTSEVSFYWTFGSNHPFLNVFKNIHCMAYVQGNYEPLAPKNGTVTKDQLQKMYEKILLDKLIKTQQNIKINVLTAMVINTWDNISDDNFIKIMENHLSNKLNFKNSGIKKPMKK